MKTTTDLFNLQDKVALVTGATRGIGLACAELLAAKGATVIISSRKQEACEQIAAQFQADGLKAVPMACHLGEMDQIEALYQQIEAKFGKLDILVNNGATNPHFGPIYDTDLAAFQ